GSTLFSVTFSNVLFTARGTASSWSTTAAIQGDNSLGATVNMTWSGANLPGYGLATGGQYNGGFGFDLTALNTSGVIPWGAPNPGTRKIWCAIRNRSARPSAALVAPTTAPASLYPCRPTRDDPSAATWSAIISATVRPSSNRADCTASLPGLLVRTSTNTPS